MLALKDFRAVTISVSDLDRSVAFYRDLLGFPVLARAAAAAVLDAGGGQVLQLISAPAPRAGGWLPDDLQIGLRHVGFKCRDTDATTARLKAADVPFTLDPLDATGGVRIAFFKDPDGTLLEVVQGALEYHVAGPAANALPPVVPPGEALIFDHIAITVSDLEGALAFYRDRLGFPIIGQLFFNDARGFTITYLQAGSAVLELFSFASPTLPNPHDPDPAALGLKHVVFEVEDPSAAAAGLELESAGVPAGLDNAVLVTGFDGTAFALAGALVSAER